MGRASALWLNVLTCVLVPLGRARGIRVRKLLQEHALWWKDLATNLKDQYLDVWMGSRLELDPGRKRSASAVKKQRWSPLLLRGRGGFRFVVCLQVYDASVIGFTTQFHCPLYIILQSAGTSVRCTWPLNVCLDGTLMSFPLVLRSCILCLWGLLPWPA